MQSCINILVSSEAEQPTFQIWIKATIKYQPVTRVNQDHLHSVIQSSLLYGSSRFCNIHKMQYRAIRQGTLSDYGMQTQSTFG